MTDVAVEVSQWIRQEERRSAMNIVIADPDHRRFPFPKAFFHDATVLYHGTCKYMGLFDSIPRGSRSRASRSTGGTLLSFVMRVKLSPPVQCCRCSWATATRTSLPGAVCSSQQTIGSQRAYATDRGGEVVRKTLEEAEDFEHLCADAERRERAVRQWKEGLRQHPNHAPTKEVIGRCRVMTPCRHYCSGSNKQGRGSHVASMVDTLHVLAVRVDPGGFRPGGVFI